MPGGGSIRNMRNTLVNNKELLPKKKNPFKKKWGYAALRNQYRAHAGTFEFRKASPEERAAIREKIRRERKIEKNLILILLWSLFFAIGTIC